MLLIQIKTISLFLIEMSISFSKMQERKLGGLLVRGFTKKQLVILESVGKDKSKSITSTSRKISEEKGISLSTVKLDLKILEKLGLVRIVEKDGFKRVGMTKFGKMVLRILSPCYNSLTNALAQMIERIFYSFSINALQR